MKVLMIAPQPFFEPRGTPISVYQRLHGLSELGCQIDLATYHIGSDVEIAGLTIIRAPRVPFIHKVKIGPSLAKIPLDLMLLLLTIWLLLTRRYDAIHSHEEAAFFAAPLAWLFRTPHLYDMHSSLPKQLANYNFGNYGPLVWLMERLERWTLRASDVVLTVGADLEAYVLRLNGQANHIRIENIAAQNETAVSPTHVAHLRHSLGLDGKQAIVYTGTFEGYQGFEMLFASAQTVVRQAPEAMFVMVGGKPEQVAHWQQETARLGLADRVIFTGTVSLEESLHFLALADVLVSPRMAGLSVPLKIYSYLQSGSPIVATEIEAHTQVLAGETAVLTPPIPEAFADGLLRLLHDPDLRQTIGQNARALAERDYSKESYLNKLERAYLSIKHRKHISDIKLPDKSVPPHRKERRFSNFAGD
ncbi:MAG: glycosyltransferase family 4 protein [Chloroflexota bacterium]